mmetsp:Transcript_84728/g.203129  ORF Transcript_84728/g.203129 Transcript_84728/m.203129 type:complete len:405 (-) Transcript_84728:188-1402(-)|eukprot:CAMPEP_0181430406 /NCGR_PEP_ID=MMETSP1110-20121109/17705_1 /TAXON_ID=174948 /ORGANISM="Symbiodinium sp., Strain CCMP421" /LENGTH=404 /DNA_ID=CAMNT_0023553717 /DNA_START=50 /DNA_END=1264 /DNA_ORIENTATION=-
MAEVAADVATVRAVLPEFEYSAALDEAAHSAELRARQQEISTAKAELQQQLQAEKAKVVAAEEEISLAKDADKARADKLNEKVTTLIDRQVELQTAEKEYQEVEASGRCEAQTGEDLREAMQKHEHITKTVISSLLVGTCTSGKVKSEYLEALRGYLQEIQVEKTLVAAADGLGVAPDKRGTFDKALAEKHRSLEEILAARAPAEKEARAELLGLWALTDVCREKAEAAEAEHTKVEDEVKAAKAVMRALRQRVTKATAEVAEIEAKLQTQEEKAQQLDAATSALAHLAAASKAQAAETKAAEEAAAAAPAEAKDTTAEAVAEAQAVEEAAAAFAAEEAPTEVVATQVDVEVDSMPQVEAEVQHPAKRLCTEESRVAAAMTTPKQDIMIDFQVASPARAARQIY